MTGEVRFILPRPPSTNALYANVPGKGRVKTHTYRDWIVAAGWEMRCQLGRLPPTLTTPVGMLIEGVERIDLDNIKAIPDLCKRMGLIADDRLIDDLRIVRAGIPVTVTLWPLGRHNRTSVLSVTVQND